MSDFKQIDGVWHYVVPADEYEANTAVDIDFYEHEATDKAMEEGIAFNIPCLLPDGSTGNEMRLTEKGVAWIFGRLEDQAA